MKTMMGTRKSLIHEIQQTLTKQVHIAPLALFRVLFGGMMLASIIRFAAKGWIYSLYIKPAFYFSYYGFEWVKPLGAPGMYALFTLMGLFAFCIMIGLFYRLSAIGFFLTFTYVELIDKTNYLNHYYFITIVSFLLIWLPAARYFSVDVLWRPEKRKIYVPRVFIIILQLQLGIVYFFAGIAKLNYDWLIEAMPLRIWLPAHTDTPIIGPMLNKVWVAYVFSWFGAVYDLSIPFLLSYRKTVKIAYILVLIFHVFTALFFQIGMFPYIMIVCTLIFISENFHLRVISKLYRIAMYILPLSIRRRTAPASPEESCYIPAKPFQKIMYTVLLIHFMVQLLMPFRYLLYPGNLFWTEQGFRFSWRVMLMEKAGKAFFYVTDPEHHRIGEAMMDGDLTVNQEKMMATQPDMILQYAHFLKEKYQRMGIRDPEIHAACYVTLNGSGSRLFTDQRINLANEEESFRPKTWILPFEKNK
jgi:hypothetical protein